MKNENLENVPFGESGQEDTRNDVKQPLSSLSESSEGKEKKSFDMAEHKAFIDATAEQYRKELAEEGIREIDCYPEYIFGPGGPLFDTDKIIGKFRDFMKQHLGMTQ